MSKHVKKLEFFHVYSFHFSQLDFLFLFRYWLVLFPLCFCTERVDTQTIHEERYIEKDRMVKQLIGSY